ncbi:FAD-binding protein [Raoultibacter timonensis]|uniref:FAD-binding dehydrogenase n=1 Tax=Raoultibacter timonensis TaxID=1907662 RepID=A0ABN6MJW7_9ACTN|nr:FAD-binding protein [Raoultibacter timonensis]BDE97017.1 FAD-binding dehydrogenase [Raoultibacter timonensis]BDF51621.1 FAD-binding dehydrogenase [Raoultibacter timonensis]
MKPILSTESMDRRGFLALAGLGAGALAASSLAGCAPNATTAGADVSANAQALPEGVPAWLGVAPEISESDIVETRETEMLIVGAGNAGMVAAATAADAGIDFVVAEAAGAVATGRFWNGFVNTRLHEEAGVKLDGLKIMNELARYASGICDQNVYRTWVEESAETFDYVDGIMSAAGYKVWLDLDNYGNHATGGTDYVIVPIQHMWYKEEEAQGLKALSAIIGSRNRNQELEDYINGKGYQVSFLHRLVKLIREEGGRVEGGIFETPEGYVRINASKGVIMTCGGYASNLEMLEAMSPMGVNVVVSQSEPNNDGTGLKAAMWIGAAKDPVGAPMVFDRGAVAPGVDAGPTGGVYPSAQLQPLGSIPFMRVNRNGRRFCNESGPYDVECFQGQRQPGGVWATVIDADYAAQAAQINVIGCARTGTELCQIAAMSGGFENEGMFFGPLMQQGMFFKADTLEEMADLLQLPKDAFLEQVEEYNQMCDAGVDHVYGKEGYRLTPIRKAPFYGYWTGSYIMCTIDGMIINSDMQVLDTEGQIIEGLYAAGNCSGSKFANNYPEYFVGVASGSAMVEGRHAVRHILGKA